MSPFDPKHTLHRRQHRQPSCLCHFERQAKQVELSALSRVLQQMSSDRTIRDKPIVAIGLLTADDLQTLGSSFNMAWPVDQAPCFEGLLRAIDEAERAMQRERDRAKGGATPEDV